jgi:hypothetical protein
MTADRKEENKKKEEEKRPQRKCDKSRAPVKFVNWLLSRQQPFLFFFLLCGGPYCCSLYNMTVAAATQTFAGTAFGLKTNGLPKERKKKD